MALMSHPSSSHCIHSEIIQCKSRHNGVNSFANTMESTKNKDIFFGLRPPSRSSMKLTQSWSLDGTEVRQGRGHLVTVAASPPTEDAVIASEPLTKEDLVGYLASGCKPKEKWRLKLLALVALYDFDHCPDDSRIGTEHEKFGFEIGTLKPMKYEQIAELLNGISERFDWDKIMEGEYIIGLKQGKQSISLEPGGQFELSGAPLETLHQTCAEVNSHLYQVKAVAEEMGIGFLGIGFQPKWRREDIPGRYEIMRNYMPKVGSLGLDMMFRTCTVQVNLDFHSEADMIRKFRAGLALQPIATALFANSPFTEGKPNVYLSMRSQIWTDTDNNPPRIATSPLTIVINRALQPPSPPILSKLLITSNSSSIYSSSTSGSSSRSLIRSVSLFLHNKLFEPKKFDSEVARLNRDSHYYAIASPMAVLLSTSRFEQYVDYALDVPMYFVYRNKKYIDCAGMSFRVRLKRYLEMRGADGGPWRRLCALPAFWVGILYDEVSLQNVLDMTADWTTEERQMLRNKVPKSGLKTPFRDGLLKHVAQEVVQFAKDGLERRGFKETGFLNEVTEVVNTGVTPAEKLLELYHGKWGQTVDPVFEELLY
ncbi:hypothetical protein DH2020_028737 [Rehmannia glutinosa]|uniref:glutamate--cysteine ligase n=1 Tax=Rehmannia glutinosa TaxID=99300 RepID=A0ABR0VRD8_REHGL